VFLEAALNGARTRQEHPTLPLTPAEQAAAAAACRRRGADAIHAHPRDEKGRETLAPESVAALVRALREAVPGTPLGFTTGAWIAPDLAERLAQVRSWREPPDFASVNFNEPGAIDVARALLDSGVGVEAGLSQARDAAALVESGLASRCIRVLIEPQEPASVDALVTTDAIEQVLDRGGVSLPRLLHGGDATAWVLLLEAKLRGYQARIGLEDTLALPNGDRAPDNAALVAAARDLLNEAGIP
jgi:uncharacterized protein (DUF849 family)